MYLTNLKLYTSQSHPLQQSQPQSLQQLPPQQLQSSVPVFKSLNDYFNYKKEQKEQGKFYHFIFLIKIFLFIVYFFRNIFDMKLNFLKM